MFCVQCLLVISTETLVVIAIYIFMLSMRPLHPYTFECICEGNSCGLQDRGFDQQCLASVILNGEASVFQKGCFIILEHGEMTGKTALSINHVVDCCCRNLCNWNINAKLLLPQGMTIQYSTDIFLIFVIRPIIVLLILSFMAIVACQKINQTLIHRLHAHDAEHGTTDGLITSNVGDSTLAGLLDHSLQKTVAHQITLVDCVGKSHYGEVCRGQWQGENVAVKIFSFWDEKAWFRETEMYNSILLCHENILGFIACDVTSRNYSTQLWLITCCHENGSLYDYLQRNTVDADDCLNLRLFCYNDPNVFKNILVGGQICRSS
uniref:receptor protein serine/threonine kinase n=1 Tax=Chelydra serpentina TaxID=8475 RepID=A0A8C3RUZ7_CHESE